MSVFGDVSGVSVDVAVVVGFAAVAATFNVGIDVYTTGAQSSMVMSNS